MAKEKQCPVCQKMHTKTKTCCSVECGNKYRVEKYYSKPVTEIPSPPLETRLREVLAKNKEPRTVEQLADALDTAPAKIRVSLDALRKTGYNVAIRGDKTSLEPVTRTPGRIAYTHDLSDYGGQWVRFGVCGDKHMCNMHSRLDVLKLLYDLYEAEGITTVYDTGNWIDGEARFNKGELLVHGMDAQLDYWIENHPRREGITTYFVAGDDHEGWYQQRECLEIGRYAELRAQAAGRNDLKYLGYAEAIVELKAAKGSRHMMVNHPGGGAAYAISYKGQKYVECVPMDTEALTPDGWKKRSEVRVGDTIMGYDQAVDRCEWTVVTNLNDGEGEVVAYKNDNFSVRCTRNHRWPMERESRGGKNPASVIPTNYRRVQNAVFTIDDAPHRSRIIQAAEGPEGPGFSVSEHVDWMNRPGSESAVLSMTSDQRKAFIYGLLMGEGTLGAKQNVTFSQRPGPVHDAFVLACFLEGIACGTASKSTKKMNGDEKVCNRTTLLRKRKRMVSSMRETRSTFERVWCPTTALGTWVMRQGETVTITGNSLQGGEKPAIVLQGHYHKFNVGYPREVWTVDTGTCCDQTLFMRKRHLQAHVGGQIVELMQAPDGRITRFKTEFLPFFDRGFYESKRRRFGLPSKLRRIA